MLAILIAVFLAPVCVGIELKSRVAVAIHCAYGLMC